MMKYKVKLIMEGGIPGGEDGITIEVDSTTYEKVVDMLAEYAKSQGFESIDDLYHYQFRRKVVNDGRGC